MTGVTLKIETDVAAKALANLTPDQMEAMMDGIGGMIASQTQLRINEEKAGPDGEAWAPWSARYAASLSRPNRQYAGSLLVSGESASATGSGGNKGLLGSIQQFVRGNEAVVGSNMVYAAIHQFGGRGIPARPYLGLSGENRKDIEALVIDKLEGLLQ